MGDDQIEPRFKDFPEPPKRRASNSTLPAATKRINHMSKQREESLEGYDELIDQLRERSKGRCEMSDYGEHVPGCNGWASDPHHILPRSLGGEHTLANLAHLSRACHDYVEEHPASSKKAGNSQSLFKPE